MRSYCLTFASWQTHGKEPLPQCFEVSMSFPHRLQWPKLPNTRNHIVCVFCDGVSQSSIMILLYHRNMFIFLYLFKTCLADVFFPTMFFPAMAKRKRLTTHLINLIKMNPEKYRTHQHTFLIDYFKEACFAFRICNNLFTKKLPNEASHK